MTQKNVGTIVQAIGPVLDIRFPNDAMPQLLNAIVRSSTTGKSWWRRWRSTSATMRCAASP